MNDTPVAQSESVASQVETALVSLINLAALLEQTLALCDELPVAAKDDRGGPAITGHSTATAIVALIEVSRDKIEATAAIVSDATQRLYFEGRTRK